MKKSTILILAALALALGLQSLSAGEDSEAVIEKKIVVAINGDDFELAETDVSHLGVGDAETIVTESGKTIDILRTEDGVEIYVDGELIDAGLSENLDVLHEKHAIRHVEVICESEGECEELAWLSEDGNVDIDADIEIMHDGDYKVIMAHPGEFHEEIEIDGDNHVKKVIVIEKRMEDEI